MESKKHLDPIIRSSEGLHVSIYVPKCDDFFAYRRYLDDLRPVLDIHLAPVMSREEKRKLLEPILEGADLAGTFPHPTGLGLFRTRQSFRVLRIPVPVELSCVVATSFHVKPLLKWLQEDTSFLLLGIGRQEVSLYECSQSSSRLMERFVTSVPLDDPSAKAFDEISMFLDELPFDASLPFYVSGGARSLRKFLRAAGRPQMVTLRSRIYHEADHEQVLRQARRLMRARQKRRLSDFLSEFRTHAAVDLTREDLSEIARNAIAGKVRKLIVADDINIFGKLDRRTGLTTLSPLDSDHEDDDLLDDLAQTVLTLGGEVLLANRSSIPKRRPALALLKDPSAELGS